MGKVRKVLEPILVVLMSMIVEFLAFFIPTKKNQLLIGAMGGKYYGDNSRYIYEYLTNKSLNFKYYWITRNKTVYRELQKKGLPVVRAQSLIGIWVMLRSNIALYTNGLADLSFHGSFVPKRLKLIALRHGRSVKRVRFATKNKRFSFVEKHILSRETDMIQYAISTSDFISEVQKEVLQLGLDRQVITGYPRNDMLFSPGKENEKIWKQFNKGREYSKVVLYGPTWRHGRQTTNFFPFDDFNKDKLGEFLAKNNMLILLRPHKNELKNSRLKVYLDNLCKDIDNIKLATHLDFPSVNDLIPYCDALICDYSALYHDFLLLDRPLIFIPYDYKEFEKENGFLYDYFHYLPGPSVLSFEDFIKELESLSLGKDEFKEKRDELTNLIHKYKDDKSTERVVDVVVRMIEEVH